MSTGSKRVSAGTPSGMRDVISERSRAAPSPRSTPPSRTSGNGRPASPTILAAAAPVSPSCRPCSATISRATASPRAASTRVHGTARSHSQVGVQVVTNAYTTVAPPAKKKTPGPQPPVVDDAFSRAKIAATVGELEDEREAVRKLGLI